MNKQIFPNCVIHYILSFLPIMDNNNYNTFVNSYKKRIKRISKIYNTNIFNKEMVLNKYTYFHNINNIFKNKINDNNIFKKIKNIRYSKTYDDDLIDYNNLDKHVIMFYYYENPVYCVFVDILSDVILKIRNNKITYFEILELITNNITEDKPNTYFKHDELLTNNDFILLTTNRNILLNNQMVNLIDYISILNFPKNYTEINLYDDSDMDFSVDD